MTFYRNILLAAALIPAVVLTVPYIGSNSHRNAERPGMRIERSSPEIHYESFFKNPEKRVPIPTPQLKDYELAVKNSMAYKGIASLREVKGYDVLPLAEAIMETESGRNHYDSDGSVKRGDDGELGIMQILPSTGEAACGLNVEELMVLDNNVKCGLIYFSDALVTCHGEVEGALTNYNRGSSGNCIAGDYSDRVIKNYRNLD